MRKFVIAVASALVLAGCGQCGETGRPRIGIVGVGIECSTFSPARTTLDMFRPLYGEDIIASYPFFDKDSSLIDRAEWVPLMVAWATPGGMVARECYDTLLNRSLRLVRDNMPYDGIFLDIHGAMSVEGLDDPEGDYISRIREIVGDSVLISTSMDPHGCVSMRLAENTDLITAYRMAPHEDRYTSRKRAVSNLLERIEKGGGKPAYKAWVKVPVLLPGEKTSTRVEPGKSLYETIVPVENRPGVTDAAIWMSYPWADEPRNHAVVMVVGDDKDEVERGALGLAGKFWSVRNDFEFVAPTASLETAIDSALSSRTRPYFVSDMGDNPTAGGAGDVTWTLERLLKRPEFKDEGGKRLIYASIPGPELVTQAISVGEGGYVDASVGAIVDDRYAPPVRLRGKVVKILDDGKNAQAVVQVGSMQIIVTEDRLPFHYERSFDVLDLKPREADIIVVKMGYLTEELYAMQQGWMMAQTRGGVDQDLLKLPYRRLERPIFPLDPEMPDPEFKVVWIP